MKKQKEYGNGISTVTIACAGLMILLLALLSIFLGIRVKELEKQLALLKGEGRKSVEIVWSQEEEMLEEEKEQEQAEASDTQEPGRKVFLTFDDGPGIYTEEILKILREYQVKATFFVTGTKDPRYEGMYRKILEEGHTLGIHTYSHVYQDIYSSLEAFQSDFNQLRNHIYHKTGKWINLYRFPGGSGNKVLSYKNRELILQWMAQEDIIYYDWNIAPEDLDQNLLTAQEIAANCMEGVKACKTAIVLLHDASGRERTIEALPLIIEGINEMEDTVLLPMDEETARIQQISLTTEEDRELP